MAESWHIPRASLGSISTSSSSVANSSKSSGSRKNSNTSCHRPRRSSLDETNSGKSYTNRAYQPGRELSHSGSFKSDLNRGEIKSSRRTSRDVALGGRSRMDELRERFDESSNAAAAAAAAATATASNSRITGIKRGSRSSQGSTDSNHSSHVSIFLLLLPSVMSIISLVFLERLLRFTPPNGRQFGKLRSHSSPQENNQSLHKRRRRK